MIEPQEIDTTRLPNLTENELVKINDNYYYIRSVPNIEYIYKQTFPLRGDEIISESGFYVYAIIVDPVTHEPLLFAKRILNYKEIKTKHIDLLVDISTKLEIPFTELLYAGEMMVELNIEEVNVKFNFLSGSFMLDVIDPDNPKGNDEIVIDILKRNIGVTDSSGKPIRYEYISGLKTLITSSNIPLSLDFIFELVESGAEVYVLPKEKIDSRMTFGKINDIIYKKFSYYQAKKNQINREFELLKNAGRPNEVERERQLQELENSIIFDKVFVKLEPHVLKEIAPEANPHEAFEFEFSKLGSIEGATEHVGKAIKESKHRCKRNKTKGGRRRKRNKSKKKKYNSLKK